MLHTERKQQPWDALDKAAVIGLILLNVVIMLTLYTNMTYFYLDSPELNELLEMHTVFYKWFVPVERFIPMYHMVGILTKQLFGNDPALIYLAQYMFIIAGMIATFFLGRSFRCRPKHAALICLLYLTASSAFENIFTVCKAEPPLMMAFPVFLLALWKVLSGRGGKKALRWIFYECSVILCFLSKETWFVIVVTVGIMALYALIFNHALRRRAFAALGLFAATFLLAKVYEHFYVLGSVYVSDYSVTLSDIFSSIGFYLVNQWDYFVLGALGLIVCGIQMYKTRGKDLKPAFLVAVNLTGWAYVAGMGLWRLACSYYIYPVAVFFGVSAMGVFLYVGRKKLIILAMAVVELITGINNYKVAVSHMDLGDAYTRACQSIAENVESGGRVLWENTYYFTEDVSNANRLVRKFGSDVEVIGALQSLQDTEVSDEWLKLWLTSREQFDEMVETAVPQVGDYILYFVNQRSFFGEVRAVNPAMTAMDSTLTAEASGYNLELVDKFIFSRKTLSLAGGKVPMYSGYLLYRIEDTSYRISGLDPDGWMRDSLTISDYAAEDGVSVLMGESYLHMMAGEAHSTFDILVDGVLADTLTLSGAGGEQIVLNDYLDDAAGTGKHTIEIRIHKTGRPADYGQADDRELGALVTLHADGR